VKTAYDEVVGLLLNPSENDWWGRPLKVNFAAAVLSRIVTNALFASQLLQWNTKLLMMFIN